MVSRYMSIDGHCLPELSEGGGGGGVGGEFCLGKHIDKIKHEGMGTCARIEISQDAGNGDQK